MPKSESEKMRSSGGGAERIQAAVGRRLALARILPVRAAVFAEDQAEVRRDDDLLRAIGRQQHGLRVREGAVGARASVARRNEQEQRTGDERARRHG